MQLKKFLKPTKLTWIIFGIIVLVLVVNGFVFNTFDFGVRALIIFPVFLPFSVLREIGLPVSSGLLPFPNLFGYILIFLFDLIGIYLISFVFEKLYIRIRKFL